MPNLKQARCFRKRKIAENPPDTDKASTKSEEDAAALAAVAVKINMNVHTLPKELVEVIASHLGYDDQVSLAGTHPDLRFMMPSAQVVTGPDFAPITWRFNPETYLEVPILSRGLVEVRMSFQWKNEGYRAARIWLQLIRDAIQCCREN